MLSEDIKPYLSDYYDQIMYCENQSTPPFIAVSRKSQEHTLSLPANWFQ